MAAAALAGCGSEDKDKGSSDSTNKGASSENNSSGTVSDGGKVLNIYCWNEEFKSRVTDYFPGYKKERCNFRDNWRCDSKVEYYAK